jgi:diadenosine tetraphosphate (Ap4A) HIT family hydrolase
VPQLHFHVIPRCTGDIPDHRGGNPPRNPIESTLLKRRGRAVTVAEVFLALAS